MTLSFFNQLYRSSQKQMLVKVQHLGIMVFAISVITGCGATAFATNPGDNSPKVKTSSVHTTGGGSAMRVLWTVSEYKLGANATWGKEEADKLLFKPLDIDATSITFDGKKCSDVTFKKESIKANEYLDRHFHTTPQVLGIKDEVVEVIKTNCSLPGFAEYMRMPNRKLVVNVNGIFFFFEPAVDY